MTAFAPCAAVISGIEYNSRAPVKLAVYIYTFIMRQQEARTGKQARSFFIFSAS